MANVGPFALRDCLFLPINDLTTHDLLFTIYDSRFTGGFLGFHCMRLTRKPSCTYIDFPVGRSSNGRTADSESAYRGSNPCLPANAINELRAVLQLPFLIASVGERELINSIGGGLFFFTLLQNPTPSSPWQKRHAPTGTTGLFPNRSDRMLCKPILFVCRPLFLMNGRPPLPGTLGKGFL